MKLLLFFIFFLWLKINKVFIVLLEIIIFVENSVNNVIYMEEVTSNILTTTVQSFDFGYCIVVNVATYLIISFINDCTKFKNPNTWNKRGILCIVGILIGLVYWLTGSEVRTILNSFILAPVSWSWIFKPICAKFGVDYK